VTGRDVGMVGLATVWVVWATGAEVVSIRAGVIENHVLDFAVGATYLLAGLIALRRRPSNRLGWLMVTVAFVWYIGNYGNTEVPAAVSMGAAFGGVSLSLVVWLFFAYPSGRLQTRAEQVYVAAFVTWQLVLGVVIALTFDPRATCAACVQGGLALFPSAVTVARMEGIDNVLAVALPFLGGMLFALKHRRASAVERRALLPLWIGGALLVASFAVDAFIGGDPGQGRAEYTLVQLENLARMAVPLCFIWALLRSNLDRGGVGDLIERLSGPIPTGGLRDAMSDVLRDPNLRLWLPVAGGWVDEAGASIPHRELTPGSGISRIDRAGRTLAVIRHDPAIDRRLIDAAGAATAMALDNARLHAELRTRLEEVRASRARIVEATDAERRRIERDLHDGAQQRLLAVSFRLRAAQRQTEAADSVRSDLAEAEDELRGAIEELRNLARGIHPVILTDEGLGPALDSLADRAPMPVRITSTLDGRLPPPIEAAAYFVVAEGLTNAARYAGTPVDVTVDVCGGRCVLRVRDNGPGGADRARGSGLRGLADRVEAVDGWLTIQSPSGAGTTLTAEFPCE